MCHKVVVKKGTDFSCFYCTNTLSKKKQKALATDLHAYHEKLMKQMILKNCVQERRRKAKLSWLYILIKFNPPKPCGGLSTGRI